MDDAATWARVAFATPRGLAQVWARVAASAEDRARGLQGAPVLPDGRGVLFVFGSLGHYPFWMVDTPHPLDMVFLARGQVVGVFPDRIPFDPAPVAPREPFDAVLELSAGTAARLGIARGLPAAYTFAAMDR